jgi:hypothetical protein
MPRAWAGKHEHYLPRKNSGHERFNVLVMVVLMQTLQPSRYASVFC